MPGIDASYIKNALFGFKNRGGDLDLLLNGTGIDPALFNTTTGKIKEEQAVRLIRSLWKATNDEFMHLTEHSCKVGVFALMVRSSHHCKTLDRFAQNAIHFYDLFTDDIKVGLVKSGNNAHIQLSVTRPELDPHHFLVEFLLLVWHRLFSWLIDYKIPLIQAQFNYPKPKHAAFYEQLFQCELAFSQPSTQITLHSSYLNHRNTRSEEEVKVFLNESPADVMRIPGENKTTTNKVSCLLMPRLKIGHELKFPNFEKVAEELGTSTQTLRRRLKSEGTHYQKIKDNIRKDISIQLLVKESLPVHEVAKELGFSEPASFSKAFKIWTGETPSFYLKN